MSVKSTTQKSITVFFYTVHMLYQADINLTDYIFLVGVDSIIAAKRD